MLLDLKHLGLLLKLELRSAGLISELGDLLLLLVEDLLLLLDLLSKSDSLVIQPVLLTLLVDLGIPRHLDLLSQVIYGLDEVNDLLLASLPAVNEVLVLLAGALHAFLLLLADLAQVFKLLLQVLKDLFFRELYILKCLQFKSRDLIAQLLDLLSLLLLLISLVLDLLIGLGDLGLKGGDALHLRGCHADGHTHRGGLFEDLIVCLFALLDI